MPKTKRKAAAPEKTENPSLSLKERMAQKRKIARQRKEVINFTVFTTFFSFIVGVILAMANDPKVGLGAGVGILYVALSFKYPRHALWAFLIYLPFGGTITYTIGNSPLLQLAKDGFYVPALFGVLQYCQRERQPVFVNKSLKIPLGILTVLSLMTLIFANGAEQLSGSDSGQPLAMGILGLKVFLGYIPLIVCAYYLLRNRQDLLFLMRLNVVLILTCCGLAFVQYLFLKTGRCAGTQFESGQDLFRASLEARCFVGGSLLYSPQHGQIRLPGTFVAPWQWGWYLISSAFLAFAPAFNDPKPLWRALGLVSLAFVFVMAVLSGQRVALALVPTVFVLLLILTGQVAQLKRFIPTAVGLSLVLGIAALRDPEVLQQRIESFQGRWEASPPHKFIEDQFIWVIGSHFKWFGNGLGKATNSARTFGETRLIETYYPKVMYEVGPLGTMAFLFLVTTLTYVTFKLYRSLRDKTLRNYGASLWVFILFISYNTYYYPLDVDPVAVYYWFFAGVILKLPDIERQERRAALEAQEPESSQTKRRKPLKRAGFA